MSVIEIEIVPLDALSDEISPVSVIKIDVEGYEFELLRGARETIKKDRPLIVCEVWQTEPRLREFKILIEEMGYSFEFPFHDFPEISICRTN